MELSRSASSIRYADRRHAAYNTQGSSPLCGGCPDIYLSFPPPPRDPIRYRSDPGAEGVAEDIGELRAAEGEQVLGQLDGAGQQERGDDGDERGS